MTELHRHSESEMGSRKARVVYHNARILPWDEEDDNGINGNGGASYLNKHLERATRTNHSHAVGVGRSWEIYKSASVTATNIRKGRISGPYHGRSFEVMVVPSLDMPGYWTVKIRGQL